MSDGPDDYFGKRSGPEPTQKTNGADQGRRFRLVPFDQLRPGDGPTYLVKGLFPKGGLVVIWGPPKCGKSYWTFDAAMHIALGWQYRGRRVIPGSVIYCAFEGGEGFKGRAEAFRRRFLADHSEAVPFYLMTTPLNLARDHPLLITDIRAEHPNLQPVLVVLDTLNRSLGGSESRDEDMSGYVQGADAIRDAFACCVSVVHHCGIDATRPRGHTSLVGAVDAQLAVRKDQSGDIIVELELMKDGPVGDVLTSSLAVEEIGRDQDGDAITACVVVPGGEPSPKAAKQPKLPKGAKTALAALVDAINTSGEVPAASNYIPSGRRVVTVKQWADFCARRGLSDSENPHAQRVAFNRAKEALLDAKMIAIWDPFVWLCQ